MDSGIYCIEIIEGNIEKIGQKYIGQGVNLLKRINRHFSELKANKHKNSKLQRYFNKYGESSLIFSVLITCPKQELNFWEKFYIKLFNSVENGFNLTTGGEGAATNKKICQLSNVLTGEIVTYPSCKEFAEAYNLSEHGVVYVLLGKNKTVGNWYNPNGKWKPIEYIVTSPSGDKYGVLNFRIVDFCKKHGIKNHVNFREMLRNKRLTCEGWKGIHA
jgi:hypothetical protein